MGKKSHARRQREVARSLARHLNSSRRLLRRRKRKRFSAICHSFVIKKVKLFRARTKNIPRSNFLALLEQFKVLKHVYLFLSSTLSFRLTTRNQMRSEGLCEVIKGEKDEKLSIFHSRLFQRHQSDSEAEAKERRDPNLIQSRTMDPFFVNENKLFCFSSPRAR